MATAASSKGQDGQVIKFGIFPVNSQVFLSTPHTFALVNLKPIFPGHVLVVPHLPHKRLTDLSAAEVTDLWTTVQRVQHMLARSYFGTGGGSPNDGSFNIAVQDGPAAGQTVPHVHVHIIPRPPTGGPPDPMKTIDELYTKMAEEDGNVGGALWDREVAAQKAGKATNSTRPAPGGGFPPIEDVMRQARTMEDMEAETQRYRDVLAAMDKEGGQGKL